jgi:hypothetical protein
MLTLLHGCAGKPYVDVRREAGKKITVGPSNSEMVAICHAGKKAPPEAIKLAESECAKTNRVPEFVRRDRFTCAMRTSTRSFFKCVAPPPPSPQGKTAG